jgi:hypothetical protein
MIPRRSTGSSPFRKREEGHGPAVGRIAAGVRAIGCRLKYY